MMKKAMFAAALTLLIFGGTAVAGSTDNTIRIVRDNTVMPPDGYEAQWWTHPKGC